MNSSVYRARVDFIIVCPFADCQLWDTFGGGKITEDFKALSSVNLEGFPYVTQGAVKQMLSQKSGGSVVTISASQVVNPIAGVAASVPMITKCGLEAVTLSLASEYAKETFASTPSRQASSIEDALHAGARFSGGF